MTRKRFAKLCMGVLGMPRNEANRIARNRNSYLGQWTLFKIHYWQEWDKLTRKVRDEVR